jgi:hypothetical protein
MPETKFYLLERKDRVGWDEVCQYLIEAQSPAEARKLAAEHPGDEGSATWLTPELATCQQLKPGTKSRVAIRYLVNG